MNLTPEMKTQLAEQKKQCVFCKLISGEMPAKKVFVDKITVAMLDIYPALKGHTLFMLKEHYPIMPYIPAEEFKHYFGILPQLCQAVKKGMVSTAINVFIANGGVAGQQSPHFLAHVFPREQGDGFFNFLFKQGGSLEEAQVKMLSNNFNLMMQNHFSRNPAVWHQGEGATPDFLEKIKTDDVTIYEDEKVLAVIPEKSAAKGHIVIYSKDEKRYIEKLATPDAEHLFFAASFAATAVFEGLGAQGTNIILKSGITDDNPEGRLVLHILPRMPGDHLQSLLWQPKQPSYNVDSVMSKIKDNTWSIKSEAKEEEKSEAKGEVKIEAVVKKKVIINNYDLKGKKLSPEEEIRRAIEGMQR